MVCAISLPKEPQVPNDWFLVLPSKPIKRRSPPPQAKKKKTAPASLASSAPAAVQPCGTRPQHAGLAFVGVGFCGYPFFWGWCKGKLREAQPFFGGADSRRFLKPSHTQRIKRADNRSISLLHELSQGRRVSRWPRQMPAIWLGLSLKRLCLLVASCAEMFSSARVFRWACLRKQPTHTETP